MKKINKINKIAIGISFSEILLKKIDKDRGDVSRSRFITKFLEEKYNLSKKIKRTYKIRNDYEVNKTLNNNKLDLLEGLISSKSRFQ